MTKALKALNDIEGLERWDAHNRIIETAIATDHLLGSKHQIYDFDDNSRLRYIADLNKYQIEEQSTQSNFFE